MTTREIKKRRFDVFSADTRSPRISRNEEFAHRRTQEQTKRKQAKNGGWKKPLTRRFEGTRRTKRTLFWFWVADFSQKYGAARQSQSVLNRSGRAIIRNFSETPNFYQIEETKAGERTVLKRCCRNRENAASNNRLSFADLPKSFEENLSAMHPPKKCVETKLVKEISLNYGVLTERQFYRRLG